MKGNNKAGDDKVTLLRPDGQPLARREVPAILQNFELTDAENAMMKLYEAVAAVRGTIPPPIFFRIAVYGGGHVPRDHPHFRDAYNLTYKVGLKGVDSVQGNGPGIMTAAAEGTRAAQRERGDVRCYGLHMDFQKPQPVHGFSDKAYSHAVFPTRLDQFDLLTLGQVVFEGGVGSLYEMLASWQPKTRPLKVGHNQHSPLILVGDMWRNLIDSIRREMVSRGHIEDYEMDFLTLVPDGEAAFPVIMNAYEKFKVRKAAG